MTRIDELIMIIPVILNLKGNLEMNLSARLGTAANMGDLDIPARRRSIILGNLSLLQVQATVVSFFAAAVAFLMSHIVPGTTTLEAVPSDDTMGEVLRFVARGVHKAKPHRPVAPPTSGPAEYVVSLACLLTSCSVRERVCQQVHYGCVVGDVCGVSI